jgi:16S rRNA G966 N2-methylase RsmD
MDKNEIINEIKLLFNNQLYPYSYIIDFTKINNNIKKYTLIKSKKPDLENWTKNGFNEKLYQKLFRLSGYGSYYKVSDLLDIHLNLNKRKYKNHENTLNYPFFILDNNEIQYIKTFLYFFCDKLPIRNVCFFKYYDIKNESEYISNIKIDYYNNLDLNFIPSEKYDLYFVNINMYANNRWGISEYYKHQLLFLQILCIFNILKKGGTFIIYNTDIYSNLTIEYITLLSKFFEKLIIYKIPYRQMITGKILVFKNFIGNIDTNEFKNLKNIANEWESYEPSKGVNLNLKKNEINNKKNIAYFSNIKNFENKDVNKFVNSIGIKINKTIHDDIIKINSSIIEKVNKDIDKIDKIYNYYSINNWIYNYIIKTNIDYTIQYAKMLSFNISTKDIISYYTLSPLYFPIYNFNKNSKHFSYIDQNNFKITDEGKYSVTFPVEANIISNLIISYFGSNLTILDGTANVGGNTISFSRYFKNVISIELDKKNYNAMKNNINLYDIKNVQTINGNTLEYLSNIKYDLLFLDPPWGGSNYKKSSVLDLKLGNKYISDLIIDMKKLNKKGIIFKLPKNFRITKNFLIGENLSIYRVKNYFCAIIRI